MKKKTMTIVLITVVTIIVCAGVIFFMFRDKKESIVTRGQENRSYNELREILANSKYFDTLNTSYDENKKMLTLNEKYNIYEKTGYYLMNVTSDKDLEVYCQIVDAIEIKLGAQKGSSLKTCELTYNGLINTGGINVEEHDNYKILTVNNRELATFYAEDNTHKEGDIINLDEVNYTIEINGAMFSSLTTNYDSETTNFSICGNVYNISDVDKTYKIVYYDTNKFKVNETTYKYENDTKKYKNFCIDVANESNNIKYYQISEE